MDALLSSSTVQVLGAVIVAAALLQVAILFFGSWRRLSFERSQQDLALKLLQARVAGETSLRQMERDRVGRTWSGVRKFRIERKVRESRDVCAFYLGPHDGKPLPPFEPGQYLTFVLRILGRDKPLIRCYSLSDSPFKSDYYRVTIKRIPSPPDRPNLPPGLSSNFFHDQLHEGDILDVKAPAGQFRLDLTQHTPLVLIGGGIGVTPVLSMLNAICDSGSKRETWFFYGVRNGAEHIMRDQMGRMDRENENVHLRVCYSAPRDEDVLGRDYHHAERVSVGLFKRLLPSNNYEFFICGPPPMMESLTNDLGEWGVPDANIRFEAFGPATVKRLKAETPAAATIEVVFARSGKTLKWDAGAPSLLEFAEASGIPIDSGCRAGNCGTCITAVKSGEVSYLNDPGEPPEEGSCLTCISVPKTNLTLDA
jgi:ferredoxin-NADP reductase